MTIGNLFPSGSPYSGPIGLSIEPVPGDSGNEKEGMLVDIHTEDLHIRSVRALDLGHYIGLYGSPENMKSYGAGKPWERSKVEWVVGLFSKRWKDGNPYSGFAIFQRNVSGTKDPEQFVGHIGLKCGEHNKAYDVSPEAGSSEVFYIIDHHFWGKGYGKQAAAAVVNRVAPEYQKRGFEVECVFRDGARKTLPLEWLTATTSRENNASVKILTGLDFKYQDTMVKKFSGGESERDFYVKKISK